IDKNRHLPGIGQRPHLGFCGERARPFGPADGGAHGRRSVVGGRKNSRAVEWITSLERATTRRDIGYGRGGRARSMAVVEYPASTGTSSTRPPYASTMARSGIEAPSSSRAYSAPLQWTSGRTASRIGTG